jgi:hypothetical protein
MSLTIRCHPSAPVSTAEIEGWLEREIGRIRDDCPEGTLRLIRLTQDLASGEQSVGWLVELDVDEQVFDSERLATVVSEMRLLGLQPSVLGG